MRSDDPPRRIRGVLGVAPKSPQLLTRELGVTSSAYSSVPASPLLTTRSLAQPTHYYSVQGAVSPPPPIPVIGTTVRPAISGSSASVVDRNVAVELASRLFDHLDANRDGSISRDEFMKLFLGLGAGGASSEVSSCAFGSMFSRSASETMLRSTPGAHASGSPTHQSSSSNTSRGHIRYTSNGTNSVHSMSSTSAPPSAVCVQTSRQRVNASVAEVPLVVDAATRADVNGIVEGFKAGMLPFPTQPRNISPSQCVTRLVTGCQPVQGGSTRQLEPVSLPPSTDTYTLRAPSTTVITRGFAARENPTAHDLGHEWQEDPSQVQTLKSKFIVFEEFVRSRLDDHEDKLRELSARVPQLSNGGSEQPDLRKLFMSDVEKMVAELRSELSVGDGTVPQPSKDGFEKQDCLTDGPLRSRHVEKPAGSGSSKKRYSSPLQQNAKLSEDVCSRLNMQDEAIGSLQQVFKDISARLDALQDGTYIASDGDSSKDYRRFEELVQPQLKEQGEAIARLNRLLTHYPELFSDSTDDGGALRLLVRQEATEVASNMLRSFDAQGCDVAHKRAEDNMKVAMDQIQQVRASHQDLQRDITDIYVFYQALKPHKDEVASLPTTFKVIEDTCRQARFAQEQLSKLKDELERMKALAGFQMDRSSSANSTPRSAGWPRLLSQRLDVLAKQITDLRVVVEASVSKERATVELLTDLQDKMIDRNILDREIGEICLMGTRTSLSLSRESAHSGHSDSPMTMGD